MPTFSTPFTTNVNQSPLNSSWSNLTPSSSAPPSAAGRKRSRDEAASNLEEAYFPVQEVVVQPELENEDDWVYGEGMTLIRPNGYAIEASSQTGTWAEEKAAQEKAKAKAIASLAATPITERPVLRAHKSQRLDLSATPVIAEEALFSQSADADNLASKARMSPERHLEPTVDDFTRHLGIGWSSVSTMDADIQAATRGWAKFIENHFPITNAQIRLKSKGLASYLVESSEGFFLFGEDLKQGRLVSTNLDRVWTNLSSPVPVFDGDLVMEAGQTPKTDSAISLMSYELHTRNGGASITTTHENGMNGVENVSIQSSAGVTHVMDITPNSAPINNGQSVEVEMDMS